MPAMFRSLLVVPRVLAIRQLAVGFKGSEGFLMRCRLVTCLSTAALILVTSAVAQSGSARNARQAADKAIAEKALRIVADVHGSWTEMPGNIATTRMTSGALIGNGSVGVAIGGTAEKQEYYVGRNDFWSVQRGKIMPVGRLQLSLPALAGATTQLRENIGPADVTGTFAAGVSQLKTHAWVASDKNLFFVELENGGTVDLDVGATMLDGFGQQSRKTLGGVTGQVYWRRVSPEVVPAAIGGDNDGKHSASAANVRSLEISGDSQPRASSKPLYDMGLSYGSEQRHRIRFCTDVFLRKHTDAGAALHRSRIGQSGSPGARRGDLFGRQPTVEHAGTRPD